MVIETRGGAQIGVLNENVQGRLRVLERETKGFLSLMKGTPWFVSLKPSISLQQSHTNNTQFEQSNPIGWIPLDL
jgi:hypothetical protein